MPTKRMWFGVAVALFMFGCQEQPTSPSVGVDAGSRLAPSASAEAAALAFMDAANARLELEGTGFRLAGIEYVTTGENGQMGVTVFANDRGNKQLAFDFVPADPRAFWSPGTGINYAVDQGDGATDDGQTAAQTDGAIDNAMATWDGVSCSNLPITEVGDGGNDLGIIEFFFTTEGGSLEIAADVMHAGWLPRDLFDLIQPMGGDIILGVTFTLAYDGVGNDPINNVPPFTDIDGNGKADVSFREIYYNDEFVWGIPGTTGLGEPFDVETVALHEAGHGISQAHFGKIFLTNKNGKLHFSPRAVMNAAIAGRNIVITATDKAGHCSNWAQWPNN